MSMDEGYLTNSVLRDMSAYVREVNYANGWFDRERTFGDDIALLHSEVSEMLEAYREHGLEDFTDRSGNIGTVPENGPPKPEGVGSEAADLLIRLLDFCSRYDVELGTEFFRKMRYNATRGHRHGGKAL